MGYSPWGCEKVGHDSATKQQRYQKALILKKLLLYHVHYRKYLEKIGLNKKLKSLVELLFRGYAGNVLLCLPPGPPRPRFRED